MNLKISLPILALFFVLFTSNKNEVFSFGENFSTENELTSCPQATVDYTALAVLGTTPSASGQLYDVYQGCYGHLTCTFVNLETVFLGCYGMNSITSDPWDKNNVTYSQQREMIDVFIAIANTNPPTCAPNTPKKIVDLLFFRPTAFPESICASVVYGCCGTGGD